MYTQSFTADYISTLDVNIQKFIESGIEVPVGLANSQRTFTKRPIEVVSLAMSSVAKPTGGFTHFAILIYK